MVITSIQTTGVAYPAVGAVGTMYAQYINDRGGIGGHPLEVEVCDQKVDPNAAAACARQAVTDGVVAVVGSYTTYAPQVMPLLTQAGIAWFGPASASDPLELNSLNSFVLAAQPIVLSAPAYLAVKDGCKDIAFIVSSAAVQPTLIKLALGGMHAAGGPADFKVTVKAPLTTGDLSSQAAQLTTGTDCIVGTIGQATWTALIPALNQTGKYPRLYGPSGAITVATATQFPKSTQGAIVASALPNINTPAFAGMRAAMAQYKPDSSLDYAGNGQSTWASFIAFGQVANKIQGDVTAKSFLTQASQTTNLDMGGMLAVSDISKPSTVPGYPRMFSTKITYDKVVDGKAQAGIDGFVDLSAVLTAN